MRAPITDKHLLEMMWKRFPEIMQRGAEQPAQQVGTIGHIGTGKTTLTRAIAPILAAQPQQEPVADEVRCPECGYLTKHTEHIGCLRNQLNAINAFEQRNFAIVNMDKFPQPAQQEPVAWRNAALRIGEDLSSVGPDGYYDMTASQWLDWAMAQEPRGKTSLPAQPQQEPIYYMRDNHTFKKLSADVRTALVEIEHEFNEGYTHGALCSKRKGFRDVHASGSVNRLEFFADCKAALEQWLPTAPPTLSLAQHKPLTDEQVTDGCRTLGVGAYRTLAAAFEEGVRFAEAAHGIKENT